jgi:hypothetical protein
MNDQHVIAYAMIFQDVLLAISAALIAWYLWETRKLRQAAEDQVTKSQSQISAAYEQVEAIRHQAAIAQSQLEAQIRPALTLIGNNNSLLILNVGSGPALNLQLVKGRNQTVLSASAPVTTTFGIRAKGSCIAPSHTVDTGASVGSIGQISGEDVQLVYESLSGKKYVSMIEFDGPGNPCKTTLYVARNAS